MLNTILTPLNAPGTLPFIKGGRGVGCVVQTQVNQPLSKLILQKLIYRRMGILTEEATILYSAFPRSSRAA